MKLSNKQKILASALKLFNRDGIINVRLQHISEDSVVSLGNIGYHFANKEAIVNTIYEELNTKQEDLLREYLVIPLFENMDRIWEITFRLQEEHRFFYLDTLEIIRCYSEIGEQHRHRIQVQINQLETILSFNEARGALDFGADQSSKHHLSQLLSMVTDQWLEQQYIRTKQAGDSHAFKAALWSLIKPYFTKIGQQEYQQIRQLPYADFI